ncbi:hypothetical protein K1719_038048 [Acacia pycnantha]|nr:hypothetical protein K1719_038048 [Acacia pycnantha]
MTVGVGISVADGNLMVLGKKVLNQVTQDVVVNPSRRRIGQTTSQIRERRKQDLYEEKGIRREKPEDLVMALAEPKADAIIQKLLAGENSLKEDALAALLITADTVLIVASSALKEKTQAS